MWGHVNLYIMPLFCSLWSLSLQAIRSVFTVFVPLKCTCIPLFLHVFLNLSPNQCHVGDYYGNVHVVGSIVGFTVVVGSRLGVPVSGVWISVVVVLLFKHLL